MSGERLELDGRFFVNFWKRKGVKGKVTEERWEE